VAAACVATAVVIGFVSSLVPALGAARTPIVEALRSTD
jgi:ABC-type lipoprotein release transport system permease subunit